jgi:hypothetical protein
MPKSFAPILIFSLLLVSCTTVSQPSAYASTETPTQTATLPATAIPQLSPTPSIQPTATPQRETELSYSTTDRPDDHDGFQVHFVYAIPSDGEDRLMDINDQIAVSASAANVWLNNQSGGSQLRLDTFEGKLDVTFLRLPYTSDEMNDLRA